MTAPDDFPYNTDGFNFNIYREEGGEKVFVEKVYVMTGEPLQVALPAGTYYVYEEPATVEGYALESVCSLPENKVTVVTDEISYIDFENIYTFMALDKVNHFGYIVGYPDGTVRPEANITRAETMKIVNRTLDRMPHADQLLPDMIQWPDNMDPGVWYYAEVQEATNSHNYTKKPDGYEVWTELLPIRDWAALEKQWENENNGN